MVINIHVVLNIRVLFRADTSASIQSLNVPSSTTSAIQQPTNAGGVKFLLPAMGMWAEGKAKTCFWYKRRLVSGQGHMRQINCLTVAPSRPYVCATGSSQGCVAVWDLRFTSAPSACCLPDASAGEVTQVRPASVQVALPLCQIQGPACLPGCWESRFELALARAPAPACMEGL